MKLESGALVRVAAIVGGFVLLGGGYFLVGPGKPGQPTVHHTLIRHPHGVASKPTTKKATTPAAHKATKKHAPPGEETAPAAKTPAAATPPATQHAVAAPKPKAKVAAKPKPKPAFELAPGLPDLLATELRKHPVVVVSVVNPQAPDDQLAAADASAGAALAGVGFVQLSVLDQDQIGPITRTLGLVDDPTLLIYQRPGTVIGRLHGYADRETVAQAVQDAAPDVAAPVDRSATAVASTPHLIPDAQWVRRVDALCQDIGSQNGALQPGASREEAIAWITKALKNERSALSELAIVGLPQSARLRSLAQRFVAAVKADEGYGEQMLVALKRSDRAGFTKVVTRARRNLTGLAGLERDLGLHGCVARAALRR